MTEGDAGTEEQRQTAALETTARNTDTLVLIAQLWSLATLIALVIGLILWAKGDMTKP